MNSCITTDIAWQSAFILLQILVYQIISCWSLLFILDKIWLQLNLRLISFIL